MLWALAPSRKRAQRGDPGTLVSGIRLRPDSPLKICRLPILGAPRIFAILPRTQAFPRPSRSALALCEKLFLRAPASPRELLCPPVPGKPIFQKYRPSNTRWPPNRTNLTLTKITTFSSPTQSTSPSPHRPLGNSVSLGWLLQNFPLFVLQNAPNDKNLQKSPSICLQNAPNHLHFAPISPLDFPISLIINPHLPRTPDFFLKTMANVVISPLRHPLALVAAGRDSLFSAHTNPEDLRGTDCLSESIPQITRHFFSLSAPSLYETRN